MLGLARRRQSSAMLRCAAHCGGVARLPGAQARRSKAVAGQRDTMPRQSWAWQRVSSRGRCAAGHSNGIATLCWSVLCNGTAMAIRGLAQQRHGEGRAAHISAKAQQWQGAARVGTARAWRRQAMPRQGRARQCVAAAWQSLAGRCWGEARRSIAQQRQSLASPAKAMAKPSTARRRRGLVLRRQGKARLCEAAAVRHWAWQWQSSARQRGASRRQGWAARFVARARRCAARLCIGTAWQFGATAKHGIAMALRSCAGQGSGRAPRRQRGARRGEGTGHGNGTAPCAAQRIGEAWPSIAWPRQSSAPRCAARARRREGGLARQRRGFSNHREAKAKPCEARLRQGHAGQGGGMARRRRVALGEGKARQCPARRCEGGA